ncbi:MAG TPA: hypothetical protein VLG73_07940 [Shinella sp.]|nr:hypothetical protein [Shinella sp.]
MTEWRTTIADAVRRLKRNGLAGGAAALLILAVAPPTAGAHGFSGPLAWGLLLAFCLMPLALSVHLLFDAALFRLAASYDGEAAGLSAVDDVLARMGLRARESVSATLPERLRGCRRLLWMQRIALAIAAALYLVLLLDGMEGGGA